MTAEASPDLIKDAAPTAPWLSVRGAAKSYGGVHALRGVDLDLALNQVYGIIGPNGAGKSTLMKVLSGSVHADAGEFTIDGDAVALGKPSAALALGLVLMPQELTLVPEFTVTDNIMLGAEITRAGIRSAGACRTAARKAMELVGLDTSPSTLASALTPVQQRLLMLAKAVSRDTRLLILDEPTAGLAPTEARQVTETVRRLRDHDLTIAYVSHHLSEVASLCDQVICVREGRITARMTGAQITKDALIDAVVGTAAPVSTGTATGPASLTKSPGASGEHRPSPGAIAELKLDGVTGARLRDVSFTARRGDVTGLTGLLGSGIAELIAIVSGSVKPSGGSMDLGGTAIAPRSPADALTYGIGTVTGNRSRSALLTRTIRDNVSVTALGKWFGPTGIIRRAKERKQVAGALSSLSVQGDMERPLSALSGGNQQRVLVSRLLAAELEVMVFDDPTVGVDVASRAELWSQLRTLAAGRIILLASGEAEELIGVCDRVVCIRDGAVSDILVGDQITEHALARATA